MVCDLFSNHRGNLEATIFDQFLQVLRMMHNLKSAAKCRIFIHEGIQTVWALSDDLRGANTLQGGDILFRKLLKQEFISGSPRGITSTALLWPQHRVLHSSDFKQVTDRADGFLSTRIEGAGTTNPQQYLSAIVCAGLSDSSVFRPIQSL